MTSGVQSNQVFNTQEPIPGYIVRERIGAGGYGEVWKCDAPGGLAKAIKFVYGHLDEARASRELKALNRMKEVRHPFLLSLERIEVVDGHLVIVTELADSNVKARFDTCREEGKPGIPRDELLVFMRDTADALDYLYEQYHLQHLDVKPENLLLVGNRVKVADFGLLKDLNDKSVSLMGGLTPLYAPPEVYDGRPGQFSDQYSLAIVYQEMLTGEPPFGGRTAAQLAAQHLQSRPVLSPLPIADQAVVARALSKDPNRRYVNCREFVAQLMQSGTAPAAPAAPAAPVSKTPRPQVPISRTIPLPANSTARQVAKSLEALGPAGEVGSGTLVLGEDVCLSLNAPKGEWAAAGEIVQLPPVELAPEDFTLRPTIFVGIGGTAARALQRLRRRFHDRFGGLEQVPACQMVLIDTNTKTLRDATQGPEGSALVDRETVAMTLRAAQDYRDDSKQLLRWMSRRWLYNIPRSLQTEGIRPLGRLALVDHADKVFGRLREAIAAAIDPRSIEASQAAAGRAFQAGPPRVYLVASIDGATGGGALCDVAYALRKLLGEAGHHDAPVCGILTHSTERKAAARDLALANAYSCLKEVYHYSRLGQRFPGDASCGLPAFEGDQRPFGETYLVHLGNELSEDELNAASDSLSEYLFLSSVTPASAFFDRCRELANDSAVYVPDGVSIRSMGLIQRGGSNSAAPALATEWLAQAVVARWLGQTQEVRAEKVKLSQPGDLVAAHGVVTTTTEAEIEKGAQQLVDHLQLTLEPLMEKAYSMVEEEIGMQVDPYFARVIEESIAHWQGLPAEQRGELPVAKILATLDAISGAVSTEEDVPDSAITSIESVLEERLRRQASEVSEVVRLWILHQADGSSSRVKGAQHAADWFTKYLRGLEKQIGEIVQRLRDECNWLREELLNPNSEAARKRGAAPRLGGKSGLEDPRWQQYARLRMHVVSLRGVAKELRAVQSQVNSCSDRLRDVWKHLNQLSQQFRLPPGALAGESIEATLVARRAELVCMVDQELEEQYFAGSSRVEKLIAEGANLRDVAPPLLRKAARKAVLQTMKEANLRDLQGRGEEASADKPMAELLGAATPRLLACGGAKRLLLVVPEGADQDQLREEFRALTGEAPTIVTDAGGDMIMCIEAEQLPLGAVANHLIEHRSDFAQLAARIHTRTDIEWSSF